MSSFRISRLSGGVYLLAAFCLLALLQSVLAANPISFCKCVCGPEHHIIPLARDPQYPVFGGSSKACGGCLKHLCLEQYPDMCKAVGAGDGEELVTSCFERDSYKDQFIVYLFLTITFGLLGYAGLQPFVKGLWQRRQQRAYAPMPR
ncbi:hypothetical protein BGZ68_007248 [Mortierella alpina]|nr:hypothetical protein BGZ68_007248 [Mortierella alpina]